MMPALPMMFSLQVTIHAAPYWASISKTRKATAKSWGIGQGQLRFRLEDYDYEDKRTRSVLLVSCVLLSRWLREGRFHVISIAEAVEAASKMWSREGDHSSHSRRSSTIW